jgi:tripartite-type tricarboxylate transporter receptor subunit TctC
VFPELPTIAEAGLPGYEAAQRYGLLAPVGTPRPIVLKLNAALRQGLESEEVKARIADEGAEPAPGSPEDYARDIVIEDAKWGKLIRDTGLVQN